MSIDEHEINPLFVFQLASQENHRMRLGILIYYDECISNSSIV